MVNSVNAVYRRVGNVVIWIANTQPLQDKWWSSYVADLQKWNSEGSQLFILAITDGAAPNARQRAQATDFAHELRTAVLSTDRIARGVVTVFSWFNAPMKAFAPHEIIQALNYLDVHTSQDIRRIWNEIKTASRDVVGGVRAVNDAEAVMSRS
jgi:hypothetical protein